MAENTAFAPESPDAYLGLWPLPEDMINIMTQDAGDETLLRVRREARRLLFQSTDPTMDLLDDYLSVGISPRPRAKAKAKPVTDPCRNCLVGTHDTDDCKEDCGHCGQDWHTIDACESVPRNRCKCRPFPQRHLARRCPRLCSAPDCPKCDADAPGSAYHRNAVTCKARCCMCGLHGHAGRDCHLKRCRCGAQHLTVDGHAVDERRCVVEDCPRWFCTKHCLRCKAELKQLRAPTCHSCGADQRRTVPDEGDSDNGLISWPEMEPNHGGG